MIKEMIKSLPYLVIRRIIRDVWGRTSTVSVCGCHGDGVHTDRGTFHGPVKLVLTFTLKRMLQIMIKSNTNSFFVLNQNIHTKYKISSKLAVTKSYFKNVLSTKD